MTQNGFVFRLIAALLLIGLMVGGGYVAYRTGITQGVAQAPEVAQAIQQAAESGQAAPIPPMYGYGYGHPYGWGFGPRFGFFPFFGCFGALFVIFFVFALTRMIFRPWGWGHHGHWGKRWEGGAPPMFNEWHKRAHEGGEADKEE